MADPEKSEKKPLFIPLRWRVTLPVFILVLIIVMVGAYLVTNRLSSGLGISQTNILLESSRAISERAAALYERQRADAQRVAFTVGVPDAIANANAEALQTILEGTTRLSNLDGVIVTDANGREVLGLLRVQTPEITDYAVSTGTDLSAESIIHAVVDDGYVGATGLLRTPQGVLLFTAVPVNTETGLAGVVLVGQSLNNALTELQGSAMADVAFYDPDGALLQTTYPASDSVLGDLAIPSELYAQAVVAGGQIPVQTLTIDGSLYEAAYFPLNYGPNTLGVAAALLPDNIPYATEMGRQLTSLLLAGLAAGVVVIVFVAVARLTARVERVTQVAEALALGDRKARTHMQSSDEIGTMGRALDRYADVNQKQQDALRETLRRQRRETAHLTAVLESLPDGIVVQDLEGRVILMNEPARTLLGSQRVFRSANLDALGAVVTDTLGPALAPGLYTLGDPRQVDLGDRMLNAQAAAVLNMSKHRVGTVLVLRDITDEVRRERAREKVLDRMMQEVQQPLSEAAQGVSMPVRTTPISEFAREITRNAVALQKLVVEMRELAHNNAQDLKRHQRPLHLETLVWKLANEWRQVAQAANLKLHIMIEHKGQFVLGDERRLRWAVGNVIDNAIKYTPASGSLSLEIRPEANGMAQLRVRDNGVGISDEDLRHMFTRFYRGTPINKDGQPLRVPGTGQGLAVAKDIVEAHGGVIQVKSKVGVGTAVYIALPLTASIGLALPQLSMDLDGETVRLGMDEA